MINDKSIELLGENKLSSLLGELFIHEDVRVHKKTTAPSNTALGLLLLYYIYYTAFCLKNMEQASNRVLLNDVPSATS